MDLDLAAHWYQCAFSQGNPETLYLFALKAFHDGKPTAAAIELLERAAKTGFKQAADVLRLATQ